MAINTNVLKYTVILSFLIFIPFSAMAESGTFNHVGSGVNTYSTPAAASPTATYYYINSIYFNDINTMAELDYLQYRITPAFFYNPGTLEYDYVDVDLQINGISVGSGIFGFYETPTYVYIQLWIFDLNIDGYSGAQIVTLSGNDISISTTFGGQFIYTNSMLSGNEKVGFRTSNGKFPFDNTRQYYTSYSYDQSFPYTYSAIGTTYKFEMSRNSVLPSKVNITVNGSLVITEGTLQTTDLMYVNDSNHIWSITNENIFGDKLTHSLNFLEIPSTPQPEDTILWGVDSYVTGETGTTSWSLSDSNFNTVLYKNEISIYQDVVDLEHLRYNTELPTQTGSLYFNFAGTGNYIAVLKQTNLILSTKIIDSDTVKVIPIGPSYISVNSSTIFAGASFDINFSYGFAPSATYLTGINAKRLMPDNTFKIEKFWSVQPLFPISANTIYSLSDTGAILKLSQEGKYIFELTDFNKGAVAQTQLIDVIFIVQPPTYNITTSSIAVDKEDYQMGGTLTGFLKIDNTNFQNTCYLEFYNYDHEIVTNVPQPIFTQTTPFEGLLKTSDYNEDYVFTGVIAILPGNNSARIVAVDGSTRTVIAYDNFTVSTTNVYGYGLELSTYESCINDNINIIVIAPSAANITIENPYGNLVKTFALNGSSTLSYKFPTSGQYIIELYKSGERVSQAQATIFINPDCAGDGLVIPGGDEGDMKDMYKNIFNFMTLPAFWGIMILIGFVGGLAMKTNRNGERIVSGNVLAFITFALINLFSIVGLFAPYTMYIVISTWIFAGIFFTLGKSLARGE